MDALITLAGANALFNLVVMIVGVFAWIFGTPPTQEELERASMRSLSWPTEPKGRKTE